MTSQEFISKWSQSAAAERANYQLFINNLCELLEVAKPEPSKDDDALNKYVFERTLRVIHGDGSSSSNFVDCYKRGCFVLEAKQGSHASAPMQNSLLLEEVTKTKKGTAKRGTAAWDKAMVKAKAQAESYVKSLPVSEGRPPFVLVTDVEYSFEIYSEFSRSGGNYIPFPDSSSHRIMLEDLVKSEIRERTKIQTRQRPTRSPKLL